MGTQLPSPKRVPSRPQFSAHFYCGQTAGCIKTPRHSAVTSCSQSCTTPPRRPRMSTLSCLTERYDECSTSTRHYVHVVAAAVSMTSDICRRLERRYRRTGNDDDWRAYRSACLAARVYIQKSRSDHMRKQPGA